VNHGIFSDELLEPLKALLGQGQGQSGDMTEDDSQISGGAYDRSVHWRIPEDEIAKRRDLRSYRIFTIDPPNAKDLDDALHITPNDDGTYSIGVHIADVSYFLQEGTPLDLEAKRRATSVYLVQKVVPMLPPILCEQLCSLNPNVDRLAFSCIFKMNPDGTLCDEQPWFGRTVIRSCAKLDYPTAQRMIDGLIPSTPCDDPSNHDAFLDTLSEDIWEGKRRPVGQAAWACARDVCLMHSVAMKRRAIRLENGALVLNKSKLSFKLDEDGNPTTTATYIIRDSNRLVEEYMLLANYLVAQELIVRNGRSAFLRNHPPPDFQYLDELKALAEHVGVPIDITSAKTLQDSLKRITQDADPVVCKAVTALLMHPMKLALYMVAASSGSEGWRHYALSIPYYTHFTSPIRRYADVVVHRLLDLGLRDVDAARKESENKDRLRELELTAFQCNDMRMCAKAAQERSDRVFLSVYLMNRPMYADSVVIGIGEKSFTVLLLELGEEARLFVDEMPGVTVSFNQEAKMLTLVREQADASAQSQSQNNQGKNSKGRDNAAVAKAYKFTQMTIGLLSPLVVYPSAKTTPPIDMRVDAVCTGCCADYAFSRVETPVFGTGTRTNVTATVSISGAGGGSVDARSNAEKNVAAASKFMESLIISDAASGAADV
jgi:DIS3-like exonuclease 2